MARAVSATWDYLTIPEAERHELSALGTEGWELVSIGGSGEERVLYLKRPGQTLRDRATAEQRKRYYESLGLDPNRAPAREDA
jgi:hypothetical protein